MSGAELEAPVVWIRPAGRAAEHSSWCAVLVVRPEGRAAERSSWGAVSERRPCGRGVGSLGGSPVLKKAAQRSLLKRAEAGSCSFESLFIPCESHVTRPDRVSTCEFGVTQTRMNSDVIAVFMAAGGTFRGFSHFSRSSGL